MLQVPEVESDVATISCQQRVLRDNGVDSLIRQCIHAASVILKDPDTMKERKTERVQLLLQLLKPKTTGDNGKIYHLNG